jgi:hypothetical protein
MGKTVSTKRNEKQMSKEKNPEVNPEWLALLHQINGHTSVTKTSVTVRQKETKSLINVPVEALFELYGNLVLAGFENDEALVIVCAVIRNENDRTNY